jgi:hypothetical protein
VTSGNDQGAAARHRCFYLDLTAQAASDACAASAAFRQSVCVRYIEGLKLDSFCTAARFSVAVAVDGFSEAGAWKSPGAPTLSDPVEPGAPDRVTELD